ncbi:MAG: metal ABC transporter substrate-binding protein [Desulfobacterales bacterium]|nr:metal ABC transporter substrate-binding protein [Desulfobacterales bacterium]
MKRIYTLISRLAAVFFIFLGLCQTTAAAEIRYVATIHPLAEILKSITRTRAEVIGLLPPGTSPHTFAPTPSDLTRLHGALALFYIGPGLDREWIGRLPAERKIEVIRLVPRENRLAINSHHEHGDHDIDHAGQLVDPHFWTDPHTVRAMLPGLVDTLVSLDPGGRAVYERNAAIFSHELEGLDQELARLLAPCQETPYFLFHPSFQYLFARYHLRLAGLVEPFPGREPGPRSIATMVKKIKKSGVAMIFTEPQLPRRSARIIAEAAGVGLAMLDPLGGVEGRDSLAQLLRYNGQTLRRAVGR